jgi:DNA-binding response OmpR family regulator
MTTDPVESISITLLDLFHGAFVSGKAVKLSPTEYRLFKLLASHPNHPVPDSSLLGILGEGRLDEIGYRYAKELLTKHIDNLRRKLRRAEIPLSIARVNRYGYLLIPQGATRS